MEAMHAHEYKLSILMKTGRPLDGCITVCLYNHTHTPRAKLLHSNKHVYKHFTQKHKSNQAYLYANHFKPSSTRPDVVSRFRAKCFLSTQLHTDVVQSSLMNILLQPYVTVTRVPGAAALEHFCVVD